MVKQLLQWPLTQNGYPEVMTLLLNSGSDPNVQNIDGDSALHLAVFGIIMFKPN